MVHVRDMAASVTFFERLGGEVIHGSRESDWVLMQVGTTQLALIRGESVVELHFATAQPLDQVRRRLPGAALDSHRDLGPQVQVRTPDGLLVRISQREPDPLM